MALILAPFAPLSQQSYSPPFVISGELGIGREPVVYVQIDQDACPLVYGVAPCSAAIGITGNQKCFNTLRTCQSSGDYTLGTNTLTFTTPRESVGVDGLYVIPSLRSISTVPTRINPGASSSDARSEERRVGKECRSRW